MRDPNRIEPFLNELGSGWRCLPDWRFGQLMVNLAAAYAGKYGTDLFYVEDDDLMEFFIQYINSVVPYNRKENSEC